MILVNVKIFPNHKKNNMNTNAGEAVTSADQKTLTFGQKAAGVSFNPGGHEAVNSIKSKSAALIDELNDLRRTTTGEAARYLSTAITNLETAQMFAVKAVTWQY